MPDLDKLTGPQHVPTKTAKAVLCLHGFGSNGDDLFGLVAPLEASLPTEKQGQTAYFCPNAPLELDFGGRAWFSDKNWTFRDRKGIAAAQDMIWHYIETEILPLGLTPEDVTILGFSQGAMTALFLAPRLPHKLGGVIAHSGHMFWQEELEAITCQKPPILVLHGEDDDVVRPDDGMAAATDLRALGFDVEEHLFPNLGHGIDGRSLATISVWLYQK